MTIITISRELGSFGTQIAEGVGVQLGIHCVDKEVLAEMARQAGVAVDVIVESEEQLGSRPAFVSDEMRSLFASRRVAGSSTMDEKTFANLMAEAIQTLADQASTIFIGRGAQLVLAKRPDALHVHLYALPETRAARIQARRQLPNLEAALRIVQQSDEQRRNWFKRLHAGANWKDPRHYDLMVNSGRLPPQLIVDLIARAAQQIGNGG